MHFHHNRQHSNHVLEAIQQNDLAAVKECLRIKHPTLEHRDASGQTPLIIAARMGHEEIVKLLLDEGADPNAFDVDNWTALLNASKGGFVSIVEMLLLRKVDVNHIDRGGFTSLTWACYKQRHCVLQRLISAGANCNLKDENGLTPLMWACGRGYLDIVGSLLRDGNAKVQLTDKHNSNALLWASRKGFSAVTKILIDHGCSVETIGMKNWSPLIAACKGGFEETAKLILEKEPSWASINHVDRDGNTALMHASRHGMMKVMDMLLKLHARLKASDKNGETALVMAVKNGKLEAAILLIEKGADSTVKDNESRSVLYWAVERGNKKIFDLILKSNPSIDKRSQAKDMDDALLLAVSRRRCFFADQLMRAGAVARSVDKEGNNAMHIAVKNAHVEMQTLLVENPRNGQYMHKLNKKRETARSIEAQENYRTKIMRNKQKQRNKKGFDACSSALSSIICDPTTKLPLSVAMIGCNADLNDFVHNYLKADIASYSGEDNCDGHVLNMVVFVIMFLLMLPISIPFLIFTNPLISGLVFLSAYVTLALLIGLLAFLCDFVDQGVVPYMYERIVHLQRQIELIYACTFVGHQKKKYPEDLTPKTLSFVISEFTLRGDVCNDLEGVEDAMATMLTTLQRDIDRMFGKIKVRIVGFFDRSLKSSNSKGLASWSLQGVVMTYGSTLMLEIAMLLLIKIKYHALQHMGVVVAVIVVGIVCPCLYAAIHARSLLKMLTFVCMQYYPSGGNISDLREHKKSRSSEYSLLRAYQKQRRTLLALIHAVEVLDTVSAATSTRIVVRINVQPANCMSGCVQAFIEAVGDLPILMMFICEIAHLRDSTNAKMWLDMSNKLRVAVNLPLYMDNCRDISKIMTTKFYAATVISENSRSIDDSVKYRYYRVKSLSITGSSGATRNEIIQMLCECYPKANFKNTFPVISNLSGRLLRFYNKRFSTQHLITWIFLSYGWPFRISAVVSYLRRYIPQQQQQQQQQPQQPSLTAITTHFQDQLSPSTDATHLSMRLVDESLNVLSSHTKSMMALTDVLPDGLFEHVLLMSQQLTLRQVQDMFAASVHIDPLIIAIIRNDSPAVDAICKTADMMPSVATDNSADKEQLHGPVSIKITFKQTYSPSDDPSASLSV